MSRSNPTTTNNNPATRFYEWEGAGDKGYFSYFDKSVGESGERVDVPLPFQFLVLDELVTIKGFDEPHNCGIYANEIRDTRYETLVVRSFKGGEIAKGLYADIKDRVKSAGAGFANSVYIAYKSDDGLKLGHVVFKGAAVGAWMDFKKAYRILDGAVSVTGYEDGRKGAVAFRKPVFEQKPCSEETEHAATALDRELQLYLDAYLKSRRDDAAVSTGDASAQQFNDAAQAEAAVDGGFEDSDIPF